ncbi:MAG: HAMP domain-containing histidine kinase [Spirochaetes bacterium]|nr:HAMP domain-containing histidine kinase [Spirochaetota bacterium]
MTPSPVETLSTCPATGLPIRTRPEWCGLDFGTDHYRVSLSVIGQDTLLIRSEGVSRIDNMVPYIAAYDRLVAEVFPPDGAHFAIEDFSALNGATREARKAYLEWRRSDPRMKGVVFFGVSEVLRITIKIGVRISRPRFPVEIARDYPAAVRWTQERATKGATAALPIAPPVPPEELRVAFDDFQLDFRVRDDEVLHQSARGKLKESHLDAIFAAYRAALSSMARPRGLWYAIADWEGVRAVQWQARVHYIERLKALHDEFPCRFAAVFGLNRTMRMMINVSRRFSPIGVYQVEGPEDADALIQKDRAKGPLPLRSQSRDPARRGAVAQAHVEEGIQEFLGVLGSIHWDRDGEVEERGAYSETHLFRPLYEAVAIIKDDIDEVFREKLQAEQILERQNRVNGLRAEIWRKAMEQDLGEDSLLLALLSHIGPALGASRAAFHRFLREDDPASPLRCAVEWRLPGLEPGLGRVVSVPIPEWLSRPVFQVLTPEAVRGRAGDWPIVEHWAGLALVALQPFRVRECFVGWFIFEVRAEDLPRADLFDEAPRILAELGNLASIHLSRRLAEESERKTYREMEKLLKQKDEFINLLGHDLKNPLTPLVALLPKILEQTREPAPRRMLEVVIENVSFIQDLVLRTLSLARLNAPSAVLKLVDAEPGPAVEKVLRRNTIIFEKGGVRVENLVPAGIPVRMDPLRFEELVENLVRNAAKFTPSGGQVRLEARPEGGTVRFTVSDSGVGMTEGQLARIFDEFYKADPSRHDLGSSGLGLSICRRIVEKHGGRIWAESAGPGKGSAVHFALQRADPGRTA